VRKLILLVLLGLNAVMQLAGGTMMTLRPAKMTAEVFKSGVTPDTARLVAVIGGATLSFALLTLGAMLAVVREPRLGFAVARLEGLMLGCVGLVMVETGTSVGVIDIAKGVVIALVAWPHGAALQRSPAT
jgi:hypothetical protein